MSISGEVDVDLQAAIVEADNGSMTVDILTWGSAALVLAPGTPDWSEALTAESCLLTAGLVSLVLSC